MLLKIVFGVTLCMVISVEASKEVMNQMAASFKKPMEVCKTEIGMSDAAMQDFFNFWKEDVMLTNREIGCLIICISSKLDLLDAQMNLHHGKALEFAQKHGADEALGKQLIDLIHTCSRTVTVVPEDSCLTTLNIANCFKTEIHKLNWAPSMDLIVGEFLAET